MGCEEGDLVIRNQDTNQEINRVRLHNNLNYAYQNCLWSPSGNKIMVSTMKNPSIYVYDEIGQKLIKAIQQTHTQDGVGAIWLSENEVGIGYCDGLVKFFNIDEEKEFERIKLNGTYAWGMDCLDYGHLLVGDNSGSISNIDWHNKKIEWVKNKWHSNDHCLSCLKLNSSKQLLLSGSEDAFVKLMKIEDQSKQWKFKLNSYVIGLCWTPGEFYALVMSYTNQLIILSINGGRKLIEFNELSAQSKSMRLNPLTREIFVGDQQGTVKRMKII